MATKYGSLKNSYWKAFMSYSTDSDSDSYTVTVSAAGPYASEGWVNYKFEMDLSATGKSTSSYGPWQSKLDKYGKHDFISGNKVYKFEKGTSAATKTIKAAVTNKNTGSVSTAALTVTVPALAKYTISYNANGGSGAPGSQTKYYGKTLKLSTTKPTRTGYTFKGWSKSSAGSVAFASGASYTTNASDTLYAVWEANTYTVNLDANGGSGGTASVTKAYGQAVALPESVPTKQNYNFKGWAPTANATSATWSAGGSYAENIASDVTLYAVWELAYIQPQISNLVAMRMDSSGAMDDAGTYAKVRFDWKSGTNGQTALVPTRIKIEMRESGTIEYATVYMNTPTATSGSITSSLIANVDTAKQYDALVTITDSMGSGARSTYVSKAKFVIDINRDGTAIAFGETADDGKEQMSVNLLTVFKKGVDIPYLKASGYGVDGFSISGKRWGVIPFIGGDGVMEVGKYLDFHESSGDTADYAGRISLESGTLKYNGKDVVLAGHTHDMLQHSDGVGQLLIRKENGFYYVRPYDQDKKMVLGSETFQWNKVYTGNLEVTTGRVQCKPSYDHTVSYATNMFVGNTGIYTRTTKTSSKTVKHDIKPVENSDLDPKKLYEARVVQFKYNQEDVKLDEGDCRYGKDLIGFIIEDLDEKYPIAVDRPSDNVKEWTWNEQYMIPAMLKLIQDQKKEITCLEERVSKLEVKINSLTKNDQ